MTYSSLKISFFGGLILNEGVNWLLKHILREPRPCAGEESNKHWCSYCACVRVCASASFGL